MKNKWIQEDSAVEKLEKIFGKIPEPTDIDRIFELSEALSQEKDRNAYMKEGIRIMEEKIEEYFAPRGCDLLYFEKRKREIRDMITNLKKV